MSVELTQEQLQAIRSQGETPLYMLDPQTQAWYVLVSASQYERIEPLLVASEDLDVRETYAHQDRVAQAEGWSDPVMDQYDDYDAHRGTP
jgi:hypothetical protein